MIPPINARVFWYNSCAVLLVGALTACGGTGQDAGNINDQAPRVFSGVAVDGYLARATVFLDFDNNGTRDPWEPTAFTDNDGYFSYNPLTDTKYCESEKASYQQYCLQSRNAMEGAVLRVDRGYDQQTGEPFLGQMSRRLTLDEHNDRTPTIISPLTSLLTDVESSVDQQIVLENLGIERADLDVDYLNSDGNGSIDSDLFNKALKIHKTVTLLADRVQDTYNDIGSETGTPNDLTSSVYRSLGREFSSQLASTDTLLQSRDVLQRTLQVAENTAREVYQRRDIVMPAQLSANSDNPAFNRVIDTVTSLTEVVDRLLPGEATIGSRSEATGRVRALESLVIKSASESNTADTSIDNAVDFFLDEQRRNLVDSLVSNLADDRADLTALVNNDFAGDDFDSAEDMASSTQLPADAEPFSAIAGMQLRVSDLDLGHGPDNLQDAEVEVYFKGEPGASAGEFDACVKYIEEGHIDGSMGEASRKGELVSGYWELPGAEDSSAQSYRLYLTISLLGTTYPAIMKPAGRETIDGETYTRIRFDYDGDIRSWHSLNGLEPIESLPRTNQECQQRLPSRIW